MKVIERPARRQKDGAPPTPKCEAPTCNRSARFDFILLGTERTKLCKACSEVWAEAYENALRGWTDEPAHALAEAYRAEAAA